MKTCVKLVDLQLRDQQLSWKECLLTLKNAASSSLVFSKVCGAFGGITTYQVRQLRLEFPLLKYNTNNISDLGINSSSILCMKSYCPFRNVEGLVVLLFIVTQDAQDIHCPLAIRSKITIICQ